MTDQKVVLVTGVAGYWGAQVAARLIAEAAQPFNDGHAGYHIIGLDAEPPENKIKDLDFIQADVRNPLLVELLRSENVYAVCHLAFMESLHPSETSFDLNVIGTMKVLGACAEAGVRKVVLRSSTTVYGAQSTNPAFLTEQHPLQGTHAYGTTRDLVEIEAFCNGFRRQVPELMLTVLRFPSLIGPTVDSPMTRYLRDPLAPMLMGFDPLMQVIHENDVVDALVYALMHDVPGVFNVAAEGIMPLTRLMAIAGKLPVPLFHLFAYWGSNALGKARLARYLPIEPDYLRYPWVADLAQMRAELGFTPRYTAEEALREFAGQQRLSRYLPESSNLAYDEERLRDTLERRKRVRQRISAGSNGKSEQEEVGEYE